MKRSKLLAITGLTFVMTLSLVGCGNKTETANNSNITIEHQKEDSKDESKEDTPKKEDTSNKDVSDENKENESDNVEEKTFVYYVPNDNVDGLNKITLKGNLTGDINSPQYIIDALIKKGFIAQNTKVNKFEPNADDVYTLDLSKEFYDLSFGTSAEGLVLESIGNTFTERFKIDKLKLTIGGLNYSSGHIQMDDDEYLTFKKLNENSNETLVIVD